MKGLDVLPGLIEKARRSQFWLFVLNFIMARVVPFNAPHGFCIAEITEDTIVTSASHRRRNHNHIKGIHACAIATVAEMSAGFLLISKLDPTRYRLIMSKLEVDYSYQAKEKIFSTATLPGQRLQKSVVIPLQDEESVSIVMESFVRDQSGNDVAKAKTTWQIKRWENVQTKL